MAWAFATVKQSDEKLFAALARAAEWRVSEFNAQNFANTGWAFATLKQADEKLECPKRAFRVRLGCV